MPADQSLGEPSEAATVTRNRGQKEAGSAHAPSRRGYTLQL